MIKLILLVVLTVFFSASIMAERYSLGLGNTGCEEYVSKLNDERFSSREKEMYRTAVTSWIQGYLSGRNFEREKQNQYALAGQSIVGDALQKWVKNYCLENPKATLDETGFILYVDLAMKEQAH